MMIVLDCMHPHTSTVLTYMCVGMLVFLQIKAEWQGDFATTSSHANLKTKYLLIPDERISYQYYNNPHYRSHRKNVKEVSGSKLCVK